MMIVYNFTIDNRITILLLKYIVNNPESNYHRLAINTSSTNNIGPLCIYLFKD